MPKNVYEVHGIEAIVLCCIELPLLLNDEVSSVSSVISLNN